MLLRFEMFFKNGGAMSGHPVRPPATFLGQRLDETLLFKSFDGPIERARLEAHTGKGLDVLCQRVTVLGPARERRQDQSCGTGIVPKIA